MRGKVNHHIPDPREIAQEIAEETRLLRREIIEGINHIYDPLDLRRNNSLKNLSQSLHDLLEKKLWLKILMAWDLEYLPGFFSGLSEGMLTLLLRKSLENGLLFLYSPRASEDDCYTAHFCFNYSGSSLKPEHE
jgi:hypothetical protein